jgi:nickel transport protein
MKGEHVNTKIIILLSILFIATTHVSAHDAWIQQKGAGFEVVYGHGNKREPYDFGKIKEVQSYDVSGNVKKISHKDGSITDGIQDTAMLTMFFDNGYWVQTPDGWKNLTKREAMQQSLQIILAERSLKFHKSYLKWAASFTKPVGMKFEIVPLKNPLLLKTGDVIRIKVLLDGKPIENASISTAESHETVTKTDKDGLAKVTITKTGFCLISAFTERQLDNDPDADKLYLSANMTFER